MSKIPRPGVKLKPNPGVLRSISEGNHKRLKKLLGRKFGLKDVEDLGTPLLEACRLGREDCVSSLLAAKADPNATDDEGKTPLYLLMEKGGANPAIVRMLLQAGSSPNKVTWQLQQTALHIAAKKGFQVCIKDLVAAGAKVDKPDSSGNTPLMYSAREGHVSVLRSLIREGADVNMRNLAKESALHFAAKNGHAECVAQLLQHRASANLRDMRGQTPMLLACKHPHIPVIEVLLSRCVDVNVQDIQNGKTPLHFAIQHGDAGLVSALLDTGAEPNVRDKNWQTPFMLALSMSRRDIMEMLLKARCEVTVTDKNFNTALHFAARDGQTDLITLLIEAGICVDIKGAGGLTPLMWAAYGGYVSIIGLLLKYGASPDLVDRNLASALMYAILSNAPDSSCNEIVKVLIRANSNLNQSANLQNVLKTLGITLGEGIEVEYRLYSPLEVAFIKGRAAVFLMLIRAGCDVSDFQIEHVHLMDQFKSLSPFFRDRWYLLRCLKKEKTRVKDLMELCRIPALEYMKRLPGGGIQTHISRQRCSDHIKGYLNFADLDDLEANMEEILKEREAPRRSCLPQHNSSKNRSFTQGSSESLAFNRSDPKRRSLPVGFSSSHNLNESARSNFRGQSSYRRSISQQAPVTLRERLPSSRNLENKSLVRRSLDFDRPLSRQGSPPNKSHRAQRPASLNTSLLYPERHASVQSLYSDPCRRNITPSSPADSGYLHSPRLRVSSKSSSSLASPPLTSPESPFRRPLSQNSYNGSFDVLNMSHYTDGLQSPSWENGIDSDDLSPLQRSSNKGICSSVDMSNHKSTSAWDEEPVRPLHRYQSLQNDAFQKMHIESPRTRPHRTRPASQKKSALHSKKSNGFQDNYEPASPDSILSEGINYLMNQYGSFGLDDGTSSSASIDKSKSRPRVPSPSRSAGSTLMKNENSDARIDIIESPASSPKAPLSKVPDMPPPLMWVSPERESSSMQKISIRLGSSTSHRSSNNRPDSLHQSPNDENPPSLIPAIMSTSSPAAIQHEEPARERRSKIPSPIQSPQPVRHHRKDLELTQSSRLVRHQNDDPVQIKSPPTVNSKGNDPQAIQSPLSVRKDRSDSESLPSPKDDMIASFIPSSTPINSPTRKGHVISSAKERKSIRSSPTVKHRSRTDSESLTSPDDEDPPPLIPASMINSSPGALQLNIPGRKRRSKEASPIRNPPNRHHRQRGDPENLQSPDSDDQPLISAVMVTSCPAVVQHSKQERNPKPSSPVRSPPQVRHHRYREDTEDMSSPNEETPPPLIPARMLNGSTETRHKASSPVRSPPPVRYRRTRTDSESLQSPDADVSSESQDDYNPSPLKRSDPKRLSLPVGYYSMTRPKSYKEKINPAVNDTKPAPVVNGKVKATPERNGQHPVKGTQRVRERIMSPPPSTDTGSRFKRNDSKRQSLPPGYCTIRKHNLQNGVHQFNGNNTHAHSGYPFGRVVSPSKSILRSNSLETDTSPESSVDMNMYLYGSSSSLDTRRSDSGVQSPRESRKGVRFSLRLIKEDLLEDRDLNAERRRFSLSKDST